MSRTFCSVVAMFCNFFIALSGRSSTISFVIFSVAFFCIPVLFFAPEYLHASKISVQMIGFCCLWVLYLVRIIYLAVSPSQQDQGMTTMNLTILNCILFFLLHIGLFVIFIRNHTKRHLRFWSATILQCSSSIQNDPRAYGDGSDDVARNGQTRA